MGNRLHAEGIIETMRELPTDFKYACLSDAPIFRFQIELYFPNKTMQHRCLIQHNPIIEILRSKNNIIYETFVTLKMHTQDNELWVQTGDPYVDHDFWGRPEEFPFTPRPSQKITSSKPGK